MSQKEEILKRVQTRVSQIEREYTKKQIKCHRSNGSLSYDMGIAGHFIEKKWDIYDIDYRAGQIVLLKNHVFNDHDASKLDAYILMKYLRIPLDLPMKIDRLRAMRRIKKRGYDYLNTESRIIKRIELFIFNHFTAGRVLNGGKRQ